MLRRPPRAGEKRETFSASPLVVVVVAHAAAVAGSDATSEPCVFLVLMVVFSFEFRCMGDKW